MGAELQSGSFFGGRCGGGGFAQIDDFLLFARTRLAAAEQLGVLQHALALAADDAENGPGGTQAGDDEDQIGSHILKIGQKRRGDSVDALKP
jgi:hypothetical protein